MRLYVCVQINVKPMAGCQRFRIDAPNCTALQFPTLSDSYETAQFSCALHVPSMAAQKRELRCESLSTMCTWSIHICVYEAL